MSDQDPDDGHVYTGVKTAPKRPLVERVASEFQNAYPHSFRLRSDAEDAARIAIDACHAEELAATLRKMRQEYGNQFFTVSGATLVEVDILLAKHDGQP